MAGALSAYMSACHNVHVPKSADIIFVEYSVNDQAVALPVFDNAMRRPYERLLRKLLKYPNRPAVVLVHTYVHSMAKKPASQ
ncbi:SGNH_hydro domain-containing protein [Haematococcus lacustris]|uniref:SGNH_hydro domain-containing protein n=1 Tax=Haematococcus lacustris TaxID=44745 RepID=A0A699YW06_HAELA|nr:SGNH_hydro domain-containing protein [Haematococcus lacustris]